MGISFIERNKNAKSYYLKAAETMRAFGGGAGRWRTAKDQINVARDARRGRTNAMCESPAGA